MCVPRIRALDRGSVHHGVVHHGVMQRGCAHRETVTCNLQRRGLTLSSNTPSREIASRNAAQKFIKFNRCFASGVNSSKKSCGKFALIMGKPKTGQNWPTPRSWDVEMSSRGVSFGTRDFPKDWFGLHIKQCFWKVSAHLVRWCEALFEKLGVENLP